MNSANNAVGAYASYFTQGTAAANNSGITETAKRGDKAPASFDMILGKVSDTLIQSKPNESVKDLVNTTPAQAESQKVKASEDAKKPSTIEQETKAGTQTAEKTHHTATDTDKSEVTDTKDSAKGKELQEAVEDAGEEIISRIADTFDVSEDDIVNAMQVLGLAAADLFNPADLTQLVTEVTGQEEIDFITDSDIYTSLQDLLEGAESMKSELMNEFDLSEEEFGAVVDNAANTLKEQSEITDINVEEDVDVKEDKVQAEITKPKAPVSEAFTDKAPESEDEPASVIVSAKSDGENKGNLQSGAQSSNLYNQIINNIAEAAAETAETSQVNYTDRAQMEDIIRQITDRISISAGTDETSMELQLHPASLGNVNILLTSGKDGIVAKFTAQNEIVKEAVEAQMAQLQQKFDEQGIKVTSVEVTVASHSFEQNLEQGNDKQNNENPDGRKVKGLRRINLSEIPDDEDMEDATDAEKIAVQMMAANGNSVDFSA